MIVEALDSCDEEEKSKVEAFNPHPDKDETPSDSLTIPGKVPENSSYRSMTDYDKRSLSPSSWCEDLIASKKMS